MSVSRSTAPKVAPREVGRPEGEGVDSSNPSGSAEFSKGRTSGKFFVRLF